MPSLSEIENVVCATQAEIIRKTRRLSGMCGYAIPLARKLGGYVYLTEVDETHDLEYGQFYHIAIIRVGNSNHGLIVDITNEEPIIGEVVDVNDQALICSQLEQTLEISGWYLKFDFSQ